MFFSCLPHQLLAAPNLIHRSQVEVTSSSAKNDICAMVKSRILLGMGIIPPLIGNPYNGAL